MVTALRGEPSFIFAPYAYFDPPPAGTGPPYTLAPSPPLPRALAPGTIGLLDEAVRFYNLAQPWIRKSGFDSIDAAAVKALPALRRYIHDAVFEYLMRFSRPANLIEVVPDEKLTLALTEAPDRTVNPPKQVPSKPKPSSSKKKEKKQAPEELSRTRGRVAMRALLLRDWSRLSYRAGQMFADGTVGAIRLDEMTTWQRELRASCEPSTLRVVLASQSPDLATPGGQNTLAPAGGVVPWTNETGLAEKLYLEGARLSALPPTLGTYRVSAAATISLTADHLLRDLLPLEGFVQAPFGTWLAGVAKLESIFANLLTADGVAVGIPWALVLCAVLKAWIADLVATVTMVSMPVSRLHDEWADRYKDRWDGYLAVALWEALAHRPIEHPQVTGFLAGPKKATLQALTVLADWDVADFGTGWGTGESPHDEISEWLESVSGTVLPLDVSAAPRRRRTRTSSGDDHVYGTPQSLSDVSASWPCIPLRQEKHTNADTGLDAYIEAATLHAQFMLFLANRVSNLILPDVVTHRTFAGSQLWGGCHSPHLEHRQGRTFDVSLTDPRLLRWRSLNWTPPKRGTQSAPARKVLIVDPLKPQFLFDDDFEKFKTQFIAKAMTTAYERLSGWKKGKPTAAEANEIDKDLAALEVDLNGLPGALTEAGGRVRDLTADEFRRHVIGHTALLLTCPDKWVFASPALHLRALRAVARAFLGVADAAVLWKQPAFYCKPEDHFDHWHIEYPPLVPYSAADSQSSVQALAQTPMVLRLQKALGVKFDDFAVFLRSWTATATAGIAGNAASREREQLLAMIAAATSATDAADAMNILRDQLKSGAALVERPPSAPSKELKRLFDDAEHTIGPQRISGDEEPSDEEIVEGRVRSK